MSEADIESALIDRVVEMEEALDPSLRFSYPNRHFDPPDQPATYVRVEFVRNANERLFVKGSDPHKHMGILQITIVSPKNDGPIAATTLADEIASYFPADLDLFKNDVRVRIEKKPDVNTAIPNDVSWDTPISVRYHAFV